MTRRFLRALQAPAPPRAYGRHDHSRHTHIPQDYERRVFRALSLTGGFGSSSRQLLAVSDPG